jgi:hypothetical protein
LAAAPRSGIARINAAAITSPNASDQKIECRMPRGTLRRASMVSSEVCADASKPVMV